MKEYLQVICKYYVVLERLECPWILVPLGALEQS